MIMLLKRCSLNIELNWFGKKSKKKASQNAKTIIGFMNNFGVKPISSYRGASLKLKVNLQILIFHRHLVYIIELKFFFVFSSPLDSDELHQLVWIKKRCKRHKISSRSFDWIQFNTYMSKPYDF